VKQSRYVHLDGMPPTRRGRSEHSPSGIFSTETRPCSGLFLITGQSQVRFTQHFSNRCRSLRKAQGCSVPLVLSLPLPSSTSATCNVLQQGNPCQAALECVTGVRKTPQRNEARQMWRTAPLPCAQAGRVAEGQCLLPTHGPRALRWRSRAGSPARCKNPVYFHSPTQC